MRKHRTALRVLIIIMFCALAIISITVITTRIALKGYTVRGVDVSSYQGNIDWEIMEKNGVDFAFIKASEGSSYRDRTFEKNVKNIKKTDIAAGAYHFMSFESTGDAQAKNFISAIKGKKFVLPPVIDLELYGDYITKPPSVSEVREILDSLISGIYEETGVYPIIYTNSLVYLRYVSGKYEDCDIWMCDLIKKPTLPGGREWKFWQYSHTGKMSGYEGKEQYIDLNVFNGTREEFKSYIGE